MTNHIRAFASSGATPSAASGTGASNDTAHSMSAIMTEPPAVALPAQDGFRSWPNLHSGCVDGDALSGPVLEVQLDRADRRITARGELDCAGARVLADVVDALIGLDIGDSIIDLAEVSFLDAAGIGALVAFANLLAARDAKLTLTGARPRLQRLFNIVGLASMLEDEA
jgi:anti-anti-sigma factor